jgi:GTP-binding protein
LRDGRPEVAFVGRSNVGKSSLLNRLLGRKGLAPTSSTPGRTQAVNYFLVNRRYYFVDLPGYGYAKAGKEARREWAARVEGYFREAPPALLVLLVDGNVGATPLDEQAYEYLSGLKAEILVAATKVDRISRGRWPQVARDIRKTLSLGEEIPVIPVSARSGDGIKELWGAIAPRLEASAR